MRQRDYLLKKPAKQTMNCTGVAIAGFVIPWLTKFNLRGGTTTRNCLRRIWITQNVSDLENSQKDFANKNTDNSPLHSLKVDGETISGKFQIANSLNRYFTTIVQKRVANNTSPTNVKDSSLTSPFTIIFSDFNRFQRGSLTGSYAWLTKQQVPTVEPRFDEPLYNESPRYSRFCSYACCDGDSLIILVLRNSVATLIAGQADLWPKRTSLDLILLEQELLRSVASIYAYALVQLR